MILTLFMFYVINFDVGNCALLCIRITVCHEAVSIKLSSGRYWRDTLRTVGS